MMSCAYASEEFPRTSIEYFLNSHGRERSFAIATKGVSRFNIRVRNDLALPLRYLRTIHIAERPGYIEINYGSL